MPDAVIVAARAQPVTASQRRSSEPCREAAQAAVASTASANTLMPSTRWTASNNAPVRPVTPDRLRTRTGRDLRGGGVGPMGTWSHPSVPVRP